MHKKLYRSRKNQVFAGIIGGLGDYFDVDVTLLRLVFLTLLVLTGIFPFGIIYLVAIFLVPMESVAQ